MSKLHEMKVAKRDYDNSWQHAATDFLASNKAKKVVAVAATFMVPIAVMGGTAIFKDLNKKTLDGKSDNWIKGKYSDPLLKNSAIKTGQLSYMDVPDAGAVQNPSNTMGFVTSAISAIVKFGDSASSALSSPLVGVASAEEMDPSVSNISLPADSNVPVIQKDFISSISSSISDWWSSVMTALSTKHPAMCVVPEANHVLLKVTDPTCTTTNGVTTCTAHTQKGTITFAGDHCTQHSANYSQTESVAYYPIVFDSSSGSRSYSRNGYPDEEEAAAVSRSIAAEEESAAEESIAAEEASAAEESAAAEVSAAEADVSAADVEAADVADVADAGCDAVGGDLLAPLVTNLAKSSVIKVGLAALTP